MISQHSPVRRGSFHTKHTFEKARNFRAVLGALCIIKAELFKVISNIRGLYALFRIDYYDSDFSE